jgi:hypothetical protein
MIDVAQRAVRSLEATAELVHAGNEPMSDQLRKLDAELRPARRTARRLRRRLPSRPHAHASRVSPLDVSAAGDAGAIEGLPVERTEVRSRCDTADDLRLERSNVTR